MGSTPNDFVLDSRKDVERKGREWSVSSRLDPMHLVNVLRMTTYSKVVLILYAFCRLGRDYEYSTK